MIARADGRKSPGASGGDPVHAVSNQSRPLQDYDAWQADRALRAAVAAHGAAWAGESLSEAGRVFASADVLRLAAQANEHRPVLQTHDRQGRRIDEVEFHPAWHRLLGMAVERGLVALPWHDPAAGSQVARAALFYLYSQAEAGTQCPVAMSYGAVPVLRHVAGQHPDIESLWLPRLLSRRYDGRLVPAADKRGVLFGMGMTERQGGSDVRSNITVAEPLERRGGGQRYRITGHKWFLSAPMCDAFLVLAQTAGGIGCFLLPQFRDDGSRNALRLQRLKDKLGNHSNASSEVEFHGAEGLLLGEEGRGVPTIIEMASYTRLDCVIATAGMQRRALAVALNHAAQRVTFGARLIEHPVMRSVLADLALESEAATQLAMYLASCYEEDADEADRLIGRLLTPAAKFHVCKRGPQFAAEAIEVLGGNGYVEEQDLARIYRELPLLSIWEGSGNVMCLDVLRTLAREPQAAEALTARLSRVGGAHPALDAILARLDALLAVPAEADGRMIAHSITLAVQGALLVRHAPAALADLFCSTRLPETAWGASFGTLPAASPLDEILDRAMPAGIDA